MQKAKTEGLLDKNNSYWNKDPVLMLTYRAVSRFASINCPEISLGLYTTEEVRDFSTVKHSKASLNDVLAEDVEVECEVIE